TAWCFSDDSFRDGLKAAPTVFVYTLCLSIRCVCLHAVFRLHANVLVPERGISFNELAHHRDALLILKNVNPNPVASEPFLFASQRLVFTDDDRGNSIKHDGAPAHRARRQGRIQGAGPVDECGVTAGIFERIHLAMQDRAATLNASIVSAADDFT